MVFHLAGCENRNDVHINERSPGAPMQLFDLAGKVAIVTGSTKGIGRGIASCLASAGAQVVISSRSQEECDRVAAALRVESPSIGHYGVRCDVGDTDSIRSLVEEVTKRSGGVDILVCNAARMPRLVPFGETPDEEFLAQFDTNVVKTLRLCLLCAESMKAARKRQHRADRLADRSRACSAATRVFVRKGCGDPPRQEPGGTPGAGQRARQLHCAGIDPERFIQRRVRQPGGTRRRFRATSRCVAEVSRTKSEARSYSWRRPPLATSPV